MLRDFLLGSIKVHIRHHAAQEPVYGLALIGAGSYICGAQPGAHPGGARP